MTNDVPHDLGAPGVSAQGEDTTALPTGRRAAKREGGFGGDRLDALWVGRWVILGAVVIVGLVVATVMFVMPKTYASSATVSVTAVPNATAGAQLPASASNDLASQYSQLVLSAGVLEKASAETGDTTAELARVSSAEVVAGQNVIRISSQGPTSQGSVKRANAMASALVAFIAERGQQQSEAYQNSIATQLQDLDSQVDAARQSVADALASVALSAGDEQATSISTAQLDSAQSLLNVLVDRQAILRAGASFQTSAFLPLSEVDLPAQAGALAQPLPVLYLAVALIVTLLVSGNLVIIAHQRRGRAAPPQPGE